VWNQRYSDSIRQVERNTTYYFDLRLHQTNVIGRHDAGGKKALKAISQDIAMLVDAGTPTCLMWMAGVDEFVSYGLARYEFVFRC
jgi:hypothetical protein